jgi:hypothetical protein
MLRWLKAADKILSIAITYCELFFLKKDTKKQMGLHSISRNETRLMKIGQLQK